MPAIEFITQFDAEPEFWQFLNGLKYEDIITELIQNELDADATHTRITFDSGMFSCEGNGKPIDSDGWKRLSFVRGAGDQAPRKRFRIGVKNHGLKTCFTLGNEISLFSAGMLFRQTLYRDGPDAPPRPGTYKQPVADRSAPLVGCRVEVRYRTNLLATAVGEPLEFAAPSPGTIESIFEHAREDIPGRFIGSIRPGIREGYTIELTHYALGTVTYHFRCTARRKHRQGWLFNRTCTTSGTHRNLPPALREQSFGFVAPLPTGSGHEIPQFYRAQNGFQAEIAWSINAKGAPIPNEGRRRYPIAYTGNTPTALTGLSVHYSAPFISDQERHASTETSFNAYVVEACDSALVNLLRDLLLQEHGPKALQLIVGKGGASSDRLRSITRILVERRAVPLVHKSRSKPLLGPRYGADGTLKPVVVPSYTWAPAKVVPTLRSLCPQELDQIDPRIPSEIIALLADNDFQGWMETHVTFDEIDVLSRMQPTTGQPYFKWTSEQAWQSHLGDSAFAGRCLDVLALSSEKSNLAPEKIVELRRHIHLPDTHGTARPLEELYVGNEMPPALAALGTPPILHKNIISHPLLNRRAWKLKTYSLITFLESADLNSHPDTTRLAFFEWLTKNSAQIPKGYDARLAIWRVWPDRTNSLRNLADLCLPSDPKVAAVLAGVIHLPAAEVIRLLARGRRTGTALALRTVPSSQELDTFYKAQLGFLPEDCALTNEEIARFRQVEVALSVLARRSEIAAWLAAQPGVGLARDGKVRPVSALHRAVPAVNDAALLGCDLLDRPELSLDRIHPPRTQPSVEALVRSLAEDAPRTDALIPRLRALHAALATENRTDRPVENISCIPYEGKLVAPAALAFRGNRGDYWGKWKLSLSGKGLSADEQRLYRHAGVLSSDPDAETSQAFFRWLNEQPEPAVRIHLEEIIRHLAHDKSVRMWWENFPEIPCIPVGLGSSLQLVSRKLAVRQGTRVFLPDFDQLAEVIRADTRNSHVFLAVTSHPNVAEPITDYLRAAGIPSLRAAAAIPMSVTGTSATSSPSQLMELFRELRSSKMQNLRKRLSALEFPTEHLRDDWRSRVERVNDLVIAERVSAYFKVCRQRYRIEVPSGFDEATGIVWLRRDTDLNDSLFEALVQRVFRQGVPRFAATVLQRAVQWEYKEPAPPLFETSEAHDLTSGGDSDNSGPETEQRETLQTHRPAPPDPTRNVPHPGPIPRKAYIGLPQSRQTRFGKQKRRDATTPPNDLELTQIEDLKQNQYAWHCQVCLTERTPDELAPEGSYVALAENRRLMIEAEHADQKHAGGARNAGNLILLCHFHHHQLGNTLSRDLLTDALRKSPKAKTIEYSPASKELKGEILRGCVITVRPPSLGENVSFFFTPAHAEYWLNAAQPSHPVP